jgi:cytochrome oxidase Cu insertion factor (SCO1/SenC/PrrC family)
MGAGRVIGMPLSRVGAAACALLLLLGGAAPAQTSKRSAAELMDAVMWNREPIGGPFQLIDQSGKLRSERDFRGHLMLVYFGFTTCPDICPTDLQAIGLAIDKLRAGADDVQPLFITVDPERDTREHLADYVAMFHPRLLGLTGSAEAVQNAADAYRVYYKRVDFDKGDGDYTVDHSAFIYLMDRDGKYLGFFPPGAPAEKMVETIRPHLTGSPSR